MWIMASGGRKWALFMARYKGLECCIHHASSYSLDAPRQIEFPSEIPNFHAV